MDTRRYVGRLSAVLATALSGAAFGAAAFGAAALGAAAFGAAAFGGTASAATVRTAVGTIAKLPDHIQVLGALSATRRLALTVSLEPRDPAALARYATAVSTPGNAGYGRVLTVPHFAARFGAPRAHIAAVRRTLRGDGLTIGRLDPNDLTLTVSGPTNALERTFRVSLFAVRVDGRSAFANSSAATLPSSLARDVQAVNGFDDVTLEHSIGLQQQSGARTERLRTQAAPVPRVATSGGPQPCPSAEEAQADHGLTADEIATAYQFPALYAAGDLGQGQTVGLIETEPFNQTDIATYDACYGISGTVTPVNVGVGPTASSNDGESALDIEVVQGMAPKAAIDVYQGQGQVSNAPALWSAAISADAAKVLSASLGVCEPDDSSSVTSAENTLFQEAAAQGQTVLASSGDQGSAACDEGSDASTALAVNDPASQPFVTGVGGTTLFTGSTANPQYYAPGQPVLQGVWNDGITGNGASASGGGISKLWSMPSYQSSAPLSLGVANSNSSAAPCGGTVDCREVPDVSANADLNTGYVVFENGGRGSGWMVVGGTSASSPLWASWVALTNDLAACRGLTIGFANPALYAIAGSSYSANFSDITDASPITDAANNDAAGANNGLYPVTAGYDLATGLGSMTSTLANSLCAARAPAFIVAVATPGLQTTPVGAPVSLQVHGTDSGGAALGYSATGLPAGLTMSAAGLITGTPTTPGNSTVTAAARDGAGNTGSVSFAWSVVAAAKPPAPKLRASGVKLSGLAKRRPTLSFALKPPTGSVRSLAVTVPKGLSFARSARTLARRIKLKGGRTFVAKIKHGVLTLTLKKPAETVAATIGDGALVVSEPEASKIKHHKVRSLTIGFDVANTNHQTSKVSITVGKLS
jgi:subtilase family serine protease